MKDVMGRNLQLGDTVVTTYRNYGDLHKAVVVGFTPQKVKVRLYDQEITKFFDQVALV